MKKTQKELVKEHLLNGKRLSTRKAFAYWNIIRLSGVIYVLREEGLDIKVEWKENKVNRGRYAQYYI